jgi:stress response protein YsnF
MKENPDTSLDKGKRRYKTSDGSPASANESNSKKPGLEDDKVTVIQPESPKEFIHIVRPAYFVKQNSIRAMTSKLASTVKDRADEAINSIKQVTGPSTDSDIGSKTVIVPVIQQQFSTNKRKVDEVVTIEKRWDEKKTTIDVPVGYEKVYVNNEELRFGIGEALTEIKDRILDIVSIEHDKENNAAYNWIPVFGLDTEMQTEFPLYAEEIIISKRKVMVGKVIIRKRQITKEETADIELVREDVKVENSNGNS